jgi:F-type H+/Na+-transporting ATPase subunit beta
MNSKSFRDRDFNLGHVVSVRGSVIDAVFPDRLPDMNHELRAGKDEEVIVEVASQLDPRTVRGIALNSIRALARVTGSAEH